MVRACLAAFVYKAQAETAYSENVHHPEQDKQKFVNKDTKACTLRPLAGLG